MPVNLEIKAKDQRVYNLLQRIQRKFGNFKPGLEIIGETVQASISRNFEKGGRPGWKELSPVTKKIRKKKRKWPGWILVVSGALKSISDRIGKDRVTLSANKKYAALQQFGAKKGSFGEIEANIKAHIRKITRAFGRPGKPRKVSVRAHTRKMKLPWGDIPARPFMMVQDEDWDEIRESLNDFILR